MASAAGVLWRLVPAVRVAERPRMGFFLAVSALLSLAQTLGLVGAESLFLTRVGVDALPVAFVAGAVVTAAGMAGYAGLVGRFRSDDLFAVLLGLAALALGGAAWLALQGEVRVLPALLVAWFLAQAVFLNHFWALAGDYFDILASKRLFHLLTVAASVGGVLGGLAVMGLGRVGPPELLIAGWAATLAVTAIVVAASRGKLRRHVRIELERDDAGGFGDVRGALRYLGRSPLSRWMVVSAIGMVLALFVSQYLYSGIFVSAYPKEEELASFLGRFLLLANVLEILVEMVITPRLIKRYGVANANLFHPIATVLAIGCLAFDARLWAGVAARLNREMLDNAIAQPVRNLGYNALPQRFRGQTRALIEGVVVYSGMAVAGLVLVANRNVDPVYLYVAGGAMAVIYLLANLKIRTHYLSTLVAGLREGKLDSSDLDERLGQWEAEQVARLWDRVVQSEGTHAARSALQLAPLLARHGVLDPLWHGTEADDAHVRRVCVETLTGVEDVDAAPLIELALRDDALEVRLSALNLLSGPCSDVESQGLSAELIRRLDDPVPVVRAEAAVLVGGRGAELLRDMLERADVEEVVAALKSVPASFADRIAAAVDHEDPRIRAAALEAAARLSLLDVLAEGRPQDSLDDPDGALRAASITALCHLDPVGSLEMIAAQLGDGERRVVRRAVEVLAATGDDAIGPVGRTMRSPSERAALAAIEVLGTMEEESAHALLVSELDRSVRAAWGDLLALDGLPAGGDLSARFLRVAHEDGVRRGRTLAFAILCQLESTEVVRSIERALRLGRPSARAEALEVLSHLGSREAASMLVLLLEDGKVEDRARSLDKDLHPAVARLGDVVDADRRALDVWIRLSARAGKMLAQEISQRDAMERLLLLREVPLFSSLGLEQLEAIDQLLVEEEYLDGEVVFREDDPPGEMYLIVEGEVRICTGAGTDAELELGRIRAPGWFGEMAILDDQPRSATIEITEDARLLVLDGEGFKDLVHQMPALALEICRQLTVRVRQLDQMRSEAQREITRLRSVTGEAEA